jgi:CBS domain-containing protein
MEMRGIVVLPVGDNDRLVGMVTDRDIAVRGISHGLGPEAPVRDVMSAEVKYCFEEDDIDDLAESMASDQIRRLPVLNDKKRLVGIVSSGISRRFRENPRNRGTPWQVCSQRPSHTSYAASSVA